MNVRQAFLRAAEQIERRPERFNFTSIYVPRNDCGTPGCALGWVGYFYGCVDKGRDDGLTNVSYVANQTVKIDASEFYNRMTEIVGGWSWTVDGVSCAAAMRLYADRYHPAESRPLIPEAVHAIFAMTPEQIRAEFEQAE